MDDLLLIMLILAGIWYWWDTQRCNEIAFQVCKRKCESTGLQLLDATVTRQRSWLRRGPGGGVQICRLYSFEFSDDQTAGVGQRQEGYVVLLGKQVVETKIPPQEREESHIN
ncbi:MAG: DUF3301 domain-containing protein [Proteobacteria bacterium]|nr:DUF3301 domain-containing protein [Pseudomonadota bacterium]